MGQTEEKTKKEKSSDELARDRTELAELRSDLARNRTLQAAERTYAAWVRTGFTIAGAGWTFAQALQSSGTNEIALVIGGTLIILGLLCFVYAWFGFKSVFDYLRKNMDEQDAGEYPFTMNLTTVTIISVVLFTVFVIGFWTLLF